MATTRTTLSSSSSSSRQIIDEISSKIQKGKEDVLPSEIEQLYQLSQTDPTAIPCLDRTFLQNYNVPDLKRHVTIVRYRGMVQDMLDSEYYISKVQADDHDGGMVKTKYRDYYYTGGSNDGAGGDTLDFGHDLAERHLLMVVPLPFESKYHSNALQQQHHQQQQQQGQEESLNVIEKEEEILENDKNSRRGNKRTRANADDDTLKENNSTFVLEPSNFNQNNNFNDENDNENVLLKSPARKQQQQQQRKDPKSNDKENESIDNNNIDNTKNNGWWTAEGTMNSDVTKCPVLAKLYYDDDDGDEGNEQEQPQDRLKLNEIVDLVGVLSLNPLDVDFSHQQQQDNLEWCGNENNDNNNLEDERFCNNLTSDFDFGDDRLVIPPPSLLPRLHVLCYTRCDLDNMGNDNNDVTKDTLPSSAANVTTATSSTNHIQDDNDDGTIRPMQEDRNNGDDDDDRTFTIQALSNVLFQGKNSTAAEAILMVLLSMAERSSVDAQYNESSATTTTTASSIGPVVKTEESTLGCASLDLVLPDAKACTQFYTKLQHVLQEICPIVASIQLDCQSLNLGLITSPARGNTLMGTSNVAINHSNKLLASPLQLPKGSALILNQSTLQEGTTMNQNATQTLLAMSTLTKSHWIPYRFDAGMAFQYHFEADYRVIVLSSLSSSSSSSSSTSSTTTTKKPKNSTAARSSSKNHPKSNKLLPCTFKMELSNVEVEDRMDCDDNSNNTNNNHGENATAVLPQKSILRIRSYLVRCRSGAHTGESATKTSSNINLTREVLKQAEKDFIERRKARRVAIATGAMTKSNTSDIAEGDFHRWLTLTRLQARSRIGLDNGNKAVDLKHKREASVSDWKAALRLDDAMHTSTMH